MNFIGRWVYQVRGGGSVTNQILFQKLLRHTAINHSESTRKASGGVHRLGRLHKYLKRQRAAAFLTGERDNSLLDTVRANICGPAIFFFQTDFKHQFPGIIKPGVSCCAFKNWVPLIEFSEVLGSFLQWYSKKNLLQELLRFSSHGDAEIRTNYFKFLVGIAKKFILKISTQVSEPVTWKFLQTKIHLC